jgi:hypothetical protein
MNKASRVTAKNQERDATSPAMVRVQSAADRLSIAPSKAEAPAGLARWICHHSPAEGPTIGNWPSHGGAAMPVRCTWPSHCSAASLSLTASTATKAIGSITTSPVASVKPSGIRIGGPRLFRQSSARR